MTPSTDSLSTNPTVPIATDKYGAPLSLPRKQTSVTPVLDQLQNWVKRTGRFQRLIEQGAVYIKGTVYVRGRDDLAILASGKAGPTYTIEKPCPTTPSRVQQFKTFTGEKVPEMPTSDNDPLGALSQLKVSTAAVEEEDGMLASSLYEMIEDKSWANDLIVQAERSGLKMLELLRDFANTANESDTATAQIAYNKHTQGGITGALSRESFDSFIEKAESLQLALPADARDGEMRLRVMVETVLLMANRQFYDLYLVAKLSQGGSTSFAETLELIRRMLDVDAKKSALLAATEGTSGGIGVALPTAPSKDPRKSDEVDGRVAGGARGGSKFPPSKWEEGMEPCLCGGAHLFAKCEFRAYPRVWDPSKGKGRWAFVGPEDFAKWSKKQKYAYARTGKAPEETQSALVSSSLENFSAFELEIDPDRDLSKQLNAFFGQSQSASVAESAAGTTHGQHFECHFCAAEDPSDKPAELVGSKSGEDDVSDLAIDSYDPTPRPDTDGLNGTKEGGLPDETEPGILSRRAEALWERKLKAAAAAAAKAPIEAEKSVGAPSPSLSLPSSPAPPAEPPGSTPRTASPGSKPVAGSIVGATNRLDAIAKVEIEPPVEKPPSPRHESHMSVLPESAVGHEANLATCDVDKVSIPHHPGKMASTTRMDENHSLTTKQNQRMSGKLPFAFFAVAVLAVTVALGVTLTPSARPVFPASATGETGTGFAQIAQRPHANLGGVSPRFRADRDSSPQVVAPVIAEHRVFGAGPQHIGRFIAFAILWLWIYPAHVTWIAIHRPIDCVRAAGLAIAAPFIAVAPVATHRVIGVGQKNGFFVRAVGSLNSLRSMGVPMALLVLAVASAPVYSGSATTSNAPQISAAVGNAVKSARAAARNSAAVGGSFIATPDSGATSHSTPNGGLLVNKRPFKELFADASGNISNVVAIGDMPVTATDSDGNRIHFTITNVRLIPEFTFHLLSVDQLWREQEVLTEFGDKRHLKMPESVGGATVPFLPSVPSKLNGIPFQSAAGDTGHDAKDVLRNRDSSVAMAALGFHSVTSEVHVSKLPGTVAGELFHRRSHLPTHKLRKLPDTVRGAPGNLAAAQNVSCDSCAKANVKKTSHPDSMPTPAVEPGRLHVDIKGPMVLASDNSLYAMFAVDEATRFVWAAFMTDKTTASQTRAMQEIITNFNNTVYIPTDTDGKVLGKPKVTIIRSDHESALLSGDFTTFRNKGSIGSELSPPHDHDLNAIAERCIGVISQKAMAMKDFCNAKSNLWPYAIRHAVNWHNCDAGKIGSSANNPEISAYQRFTGKQPKVNDLATFGCRAVVLRPPQHKVKSDLSTNGWVGAFLGRSDSVNGYFVDVGDRIVDSSSVSVDEEFFPYFARDKGGECHKPLAPATTKGNAADTGQGPGGGEGGNQPILSDPTSLCALLLFSGPTGRTSTLGGHLKRSGWAEVSEIDNDAETGGGWSHDLMNDAVFTSIMADAHAGKFDALMVAHPCSTFSVSRLFDARNSGNKDSGPPPVRTAEYPDGLPDDLIDPRHQKELKQSIKLLDRMVQVCIAAHSSPKKTTIVLENPSDRSVKGSNAYQKDVSNHGSLWATSQFKSLKDSIPLSSMCTFAQCMFNGGVKQKYTTLWYTNDAARLLDQLNQPAYQCNHSSHSEWAGGRGPSGEWLSAKSAAYPEALNAFLAQALTAARTGDPRPVDAVTKSRSAPREKAAGSNDFLSPSMELRGGDGAAVESPRPGVPPASVTGDDRDPSIGVPSPVAFLGFGDRDPPSLNKRVVRPHIQAARDARLRRIDEGQAEGTPSVESRVAGPPTDAPVIEPSSVAVSSSQPRYDCDSDPVGYALRADSPGAPTNYREAAATPDFPGAMLTEIENHRHNESWTVIDRTEVPSGRRLHNLTWVFKHKRCGKAKARLCVQGCTMIPQIDYDQVFAATARSSSNRTICALAAAFGCELRAFDWTAAYLQGDFEEEEVIYCRMPEGFVELDKTGAPRVCRIEKPVYGAPQSGRRLQRKIFAWLSSCGEAIPGLTVRRLEDSDGCVVVCDNENGEILILGLYVDNLIIAHSAKLTEDGAPVDAGSIYAQFTAKLASDWEVEDEGPLKDMLGVEVQRNKDGSITLHQRGYVRKVLEKYLPSLPEGKTGLDPRCVIPHSLDLVKKVESVTCDTSIDSKEAKFPDLVKPFQERIGSLMYLSTNTRPDIAFAVNQLCRVMAKPTPELVEELDLVFIYLHYYPEIGLTYENEPICLSAASDASWETRYSTSAWLIMITAAGACVAWGSTKPKCVALSTAEAEIIALSEAAKEVVYFRKFLRGVNKSYITGPTRLETDSKAAFDLSYNPEHHGRTKHVARRHFFVRDQVEEGEISVRLVKTDDNAADFFSKPLKPSSFFSLRDSIMNIQRE